MIKKGEYYHYKQKTTRGYYEAIVKVKKGQQDDYFWGDAINVIQNPVNWKNSNITFHIKSIIKEITKETNPEYFL